MDLIFQLIIEDRQNFVNLKVAAFRKTIQSAIHIPLAIAIVAEKRDVS